MLDIVEREGVDRRAGRGEEGWCERKGTERRAW